RGPRNRHRGGGDILLRVRHVVLRPRGDFHCRAHERRGRQHHERVQRARSEQEDIAHRSSASSSVGSARRVEEKARDERLQDGQVRRGVL
ncbi:unnamed protein product, partial [Ectocarpus sp. 12 AP-2014]